MEVKGRVGLRGEICLKIMEEKMVGWIERKERFGLCLRKKASVKVSEVASSVKRKKNVWGWMETEDSAKRKGRRKKNIHLNYG